MMKTFAIVNRLECQIPYLLTCVRHKATNIGYSVMIKLITGVCFMAYQSFPGYLMLNSVVLISNR